MADKKKVPMIRFSGFDHEWDKKQFDAVFDMISNNTLSRDNLNYVGGSTQNVHYGDILTVFGEYLDLDRQKLPFINDEDVASKFQNSILKDNDIIIADTAEDEMVGRCTEIGNIGEKKVLAGLHTIPCRPKEKYASKYMGYYLNSEAYHHKLLPLMQGVKVISISKSGIQGTALLLSKKYDEQEKIGEFLYSLDERISLAEQKLDKLIVFKQTMLIKMFPKKGELIPEIRIQGFTKKWNRWTFGELALYKKGPFGSALKKELFVPKSSDTVKVYEQQNAINKNWKLERYYITKEYAEKLSGFRVDGGDIIVSCAGTIGETYVLPIDAEPGIINQALMRIKVNEDIVNKKMFVILFTNMIDEFTKVHSNGSAMKNIPPFDALKPMEVLVPQPEEQDAIADYFYCLEELIKLQKNEIIKMKNTKSACMKRMFV